MTLAHSLTLRHTVTQSMICHYSDITRQLSHLSTGVTDRGNLKLTLSSYIGGYLLGLALFDEAPCWSVHLFELDPALVKELISDCNIHCSALI